MSTLITEPTASSMLELLHDSSRRLRWRYAPGVDHAALQHQLERMRGVEGVRKVESIRSITVLHDGRRTTHDALLRAAQHTRARRRADQPPTGRAATNAGADLWSEVLAGAAIPALPSSVRPYAALALVIGRAAMAHERWRSAPVALLLDSVALATTALTGHPVTAGLSVALGALSEGWSGQLLADTDQLLEHIVPIENALYAVVRGDKRHELAPDSILPRDTVHLAADWIVPADGIVRTGHGTVAAEGLIPGAEVRTVKKGDHLFGGERIGSGQIELLVQRTPARSRAARLREHIRHAIRSRDEPSKLSHNVERLIALPITSAGLVAALTGDASRAAAMLQADPQRGLALAQPVAREASLYTLMRAGVMLTGLESMERLGAATTFAFQDIGILTTPEWSVSRIDRIAQSISAADVHAWLGRLAGANGKPSEGSGIADHLLANWREHGTVLRDGKRVLHVCGADLARTTWDIELPHLERRGLVRRLAIVCEGELLAIVTFASPLRPGAAAALAALRRMGVRRLAIFTEDLAPEPAIGLDTLGADEIISTDRHAQARWLAAATERGERVALVHTGLRDLVPPGGLSLCPIDAEAGAHGVLIGDPLAALLNGRSLAAQVQRRLLRQYGATVVVNGLLMGMSAMRLVPPVFTATMHHAVAFLLLQDSLRLVQLPSLARAH